jgi:DNA repair protein RadA/Sms
MAKTKSVYICQNCGTDSPKWIGKCPSCGEWNSYVEEIISKDTSPKMIMAGLEITKQKPVRLHEVETSEETRIDTSSNELNRVLGGGLVPGSLVLIGGEPGIGKSTLVLQVVLGTIRTFKSFLLKNLLKKAEITNLKLAKDVSLSIINPSN